MKIDDTTKLSTTEWPCISCDSKRLGCFSSVTPTQGFPSNRKLPLLIALSLSYVVSCDSSTDVWQPKPAASRSILSQAKLQYKVARQCYRNVYTSRRVKEMSPRIKTHLEIIPAVFPLSGLPKAWQQFPIERFYPPKPHRAKPGPKYHRIAKCSNYRGGLAFLSHRNFAHQFYQFLFTVFQNSLPQHQRQSDSAVSGTYT